MIRNYTRIGLLVVAMFGGASSAAASAERPEQVVQQTAVQLLDEVRRDRQALQNDPAALHQLVSKLVLPHIDTEYVAQLVLGRYWREATLSQKQRFTAAFAHMLVNTYGNALLAYENEIIEWHPAVTITGDNATVRSRVVRANAPPIPMNYSLRLSDGRWRVYDISVDAVSLVTNYRGSFASAIRRDGLEGLITRISSTQ
jgi:phospholipid transport system substrate-binding protein